MVGGAATAALVNAAAVAKLLPAGGPAAGAQGGCGRRHGGALAIRVCQAVSPAALRSSSNSSTWRSSATPYAAGAGGGGSGGEAAGGPAATGEHWSFVYAILPRVTRTFTLMTTPLTPAELRNALCVFYLVLRALDTVEDDTSIPIEVKVTILQEFHRHIYNRDWHFSCGTKDFKVLMDKFHYISTAFLELDPEYQKVIEETIRRLGAGMAKFICKEVETVEEYDEYCRYASGLFFCGVSRLFHYTGLENLAPDSISNSTGLFVQKMDIIRDYLEDINEVPKPRKFWPQEIWIKYIDRLEYFKYEENSEKAIQCLNEMVTDGLTHAEDSLRYLSLLQDVTSLRFWAPLLVMTIAVYAHCYSNVNIFRDVFKIRTGLLAQIFDETNSMADVFTAFYNSSLLIESKIDDNDPNAMLTRKQVNAIKETCKSSGLLKRNRGYDLDRSITAIMG